MTFKRKDSQIFDTLLLTLEGLWLVSLSGLVLPVSQIIKDKNWKLVRSSCCLSSVNIQGFSISLNKVNRILQIYIFSNGSKFINHTFLQIQVGSWGHSQLLLYSSSHPFQSHFSLSCFYLPLDVLSLSCVFSPMLSFSCCLCQPYPLSPERLPCGCGFTPHCAWPFLPAVFLSWLFCSPPSLLYLSIFLFTFVSCCLILLSPKGCFPKRS